MNVSIIESIELIDLINSVLAVPAFFISVYLLWTKNSIFYKFHVEEKLSPITDGENKTTGYSTQPTFTITNLSNHEWRIKKICIAQLPWIKSMMTPARGCGRACKIDINKLDILSEFPLDRENLFIQRPDTHLPIPPGDERALLMSEQAGVSLYLNKPKPNPKRCHWIAIINGPKCLVGNRVECIAKEMEAKL